MPEIYRICPFADNMDALAEKEQELEALVKSLDKTCTRYKTEISTEMTKLCPLQVSSTSEYLLR